MRRHVLLGDIFVKHVLNATIEENEYEKAVSKIREECSDDALLLSLFNPIAILCRTIAKQNLELEEFRRKTKPIISDDKVSSKEKSTLDESVANSLQNIKKKAKEEQEKRLEKRLSSLK